MAAASGAPDPSAMEDFEALRLGCELLLNKLRQDENVRDLGEQLNASGAGGRNSCALHYFAEPYTGAWGGTMDAEGITGVPAALQEQYRHLKCMSFMGVLPEVSCAWVSIDNRLYLWDYERARLQGEADFLEFDGLDQIIVSVALVPPRPGVFREKVKYLLAVATAVEVVLLALAFEDPDASLAATHPGLRGTPTLRPTAFSLPSDSVTMIVLRGTNMGRLFMGGSDGSLHEVIYGQADDFGFGAALGLTGGPRKCRKLNHSSSPLASLVPGFFRQLSAPAKPIVDVVVDDLRHVLYTLAEDHVLEAFDLGVDGEQLRSIGTRVSLPRAAKSWCERHASMSRPAPDARLFVSSPPSGALDKIVGMHVVPPTEARDVHLVLVSNAGFRFFFTTSRRGGFGRPQTLALVHVRAPPPPEMSGGRREPLEGCVPKYIPGTSTRHVHASHYVHGCLVTAAGAADDPDELRLSHADLCAERDVVAGLSHWSGGGRASAALQEATQATSTPLKLWALGEAAPLMTDLPHAHLVALNYTSRTPGLPDLPHFLNPGGGGGRNGATGGGRAVPPPTPLTMGHAGRDPGAGIAPGDLGDVVPLDELATQPWGPRRAFLGLSSAGVHRFSKRRPVDHLVQLLRRDDGPGLAQFFQLFGREQSCAMCFGVSVGVPSDLTPFGGSGSGSGAAAGAIVPSEGAGNPVMAKLRQRAVLVAQQLGGQPSISPPPGGDGDSAPSSTHTVFTPEFSYSDHHDGLVLLLSRLLRPLWFKPLVLTEGMQLGPRDVRLLCDLSELERVLTPLSQLRDLLRSHYAKAIANPMVPAPVAMPSVGPDPPTPSSQPHSLLTRMLLLYSTSQMGSEEARREEAKKREEASIHLIYRLVCRATQALALIRTLLKAMTAGVTVEWKKLHKVQLSELCCCKAAHKKVREVLAKLVGVVGGEEGGLGLADRLAESLAVECDTYFHNGDRFTYEGMKLLRSALTLPHSHPDFEPSVSKAVALLTKAAGFWMDPDVELKAAMELLVAAKNHDAVVGVGLSCAEGEKRGKRSPGALALLPTPPAAQEGGGAFSWEKRLYHDSSSSAEPSSGDSSRRRRCYAIILQALDRLLHHQRRVGAGATDPSITLPSPGPAPGTPAFPAEEAEKLADRFIAVALASRDAAWHEALYKYLKGASAERLVRVQSEYITEFLQREDVLLLWRHHQVAGRFEAAALLMGQLARTEAPTAIATRVEYLTRAVQAGRQARHAGEFGNGESVTELQEQLEISVLQMMIYEHLGRLDPPLPAEELEMLGTQLLDVSTLYNDFAARYGAWSLCLQIIHVCAHDDPDVVAGLWKAIIWREVPERAGLVEIEAWLERNREGVLRDPIAGSIGSFEGGAWLPKLEREVMKTVRQLLTSTAASSTLRPDAELSRALPLGLVVLELENIAAKSHWVEGGGRGDRGWVARILLEAGVPHGSLFQIYRTAIQRGEHNQAFFQLYLLRQVASLLQLWVEAAGLANDAMAVGAVGGPSPDAMAQLSYAVGKGLGQQLDGFKTKLRTLTGPGVTPDEAESISAQLRAVESLLTALH